ncbi:MAG: ABC transporter ATP-binding protein [Nitriliruptorales bacterium]
MNEDGLAVELRGITKRFPGVVANRDIDLRVEAGEIHAIVGENGAGKSTLMKTLYGMHRPDEGQILIEGSPVDFGSPKDAIEAGIGMVHQHFMLADNLTVLENIVLGAEPSRGVALDRRTAHRRIEDLGARYGMAVDADRPLGELEVGQRQRVEIVKVLYRGARILILDEPTSVLVPQEVDELFRNLRDLVTQGQTVLFISHKLDEVLEIADTISVMRGGQMVATVKPGAVDTRRLAELMVGTELPRPEAREPTVTDVAELEVEELGVLGDDGRWRLQDVSFGVHRGEIVGIAGVEGNGQGTLVDALLGLVGATAGRIRFAGEDVTGWSTRRRREAGMAYIPEDRHRRGLLLPQPLWENAMLGRQTRPPVARGPWIRPDAARELAAQIIAEFDVRTPGPDASTHVLSGGNQQKFIVGREMIARPSLLIAAHPTRGVDVGAQGAIWKQLHEARAQGLAVLLVSADLEELIGLSDTLHVILRGRLVAELDPGPVTPEDLGSHMTAAGAAPVEPLAPPEAPEGGSGSSPGGATGWTTPGDRP